MLLSFDYQDKPVFFEYEKDETGEIIITCFHRFFNEIFPGNKVSLSALKAQVDAGAYKKSDFIRQLMDATRDLK